MTKSTTASRGIRYREHPTRRHGVRRDRYFTLRFSVDGKQIEEALGWASDGWTLQLAQEKLVELKKAKRTGEGFQTLREAREANRQAKQEKAEAEAARRRRQRTVGQLWDRYTKEVIAVDNKPSTAIHKTYLWRGYIAPKIGDLNINEVTDEDAGLVVRAPLRLNHRSQVIGGKAKAGNLYRLLHHMFAKALQWGLRSRALGNPLESIREPKGGRRERLLTESEIDALLKGLEQADGKEHPMAVLAIRAILMTGARVGEILTLRWQDIHRDEMELHLADTKTGFSRRSISADALALFDSVERMVGVDFVFRSVWPPTAPLSYYTVQTAFQRIALLAGVERCTLHTLRHWFTTQTANTARNARVGMLLTGHKSLQVYMGYVHADKEQATAVANEIGQYISGLGKSSPTVVPIKRSHPNGTSSH